MSDLILDCTIVQSGPIDFWPIQEKDRCAVPACFELRCVALIGRGLLRICQPFGRRLGVLVEDGPSVATCGTPKAQPEELNDNDRDCG